MTLEVINAKFYYKKDQILFDKLSFKLHPGEILAVMGANGAGKTSLIRCICGFEKFIEGRLKINDKDLEEIPKKDLRDQMSYIPQKREAAFSYTGIDMVVFGLANKIGPFGKPSDADYILAEKIMRDLGITHLENKPCSKISGGEYQMLIIARALIKSPQILILDEAESGLDFKNQLKIIHLLKNLAKKRKMTIIFNTHYPNYALKIADKVLILQKNDKYFYGSKDIINEENIKKAFGVDALIKNITTNGKTEKILIPYKLLEN